MPKVARILKDGNKMDYVATAPVSNGDVVVVEDIVGVSHGNGEIGDIVAMDYTGTIEIAGTASTAFIQGSICYFNNTTKTATLTVGTNLVLGVVVVGKGATAGNIEVDMGVRV